ncbi:MAG TPA: ABC transporter permease [Terracidiphilus sp.]|jgi:predicted permease|nr:ABC transporter permease [Terracidiphilus sp.]
MKILDWLRFRMSTLFQREQLRDEMEEELRSHIQHCADDLERSGVGRAEAERRARIEFGGREKYKEAIHVSMGGNFTETCAQDIRFSLRQLRKSPGFTFVAVLTLALAIGANALVFAVMNGLFLRPLNVPDGHSLYAIQRGNDKYIVQSYPDYQDLRDRNRSFDGLAAYNIVQAGLDTGKDPSHVWLYAVSGNYFDVLGIHPYLGRFIQTSDEHGPSSAPYIVLTYRYWHSHFQDDRGVVGRTVQLNKHPYTIIGVAPPEFLGTLLFFSPDFFVPMVNEDQLDGSANMKDRGRRWVFEVLGHLKPGVTTAQAAADLSSIGSYLEKTYPKEDDQSSFSLVRPGLHGDFFAPAMRAFLAGLMLLAGTILLGACANLGSLFAARAADRGREVALRLALGSSRMRILRQLMTEATLISLAGGAAGLAGSVVLLHRLSGWQPFPQFPMNMPVTPDANVYLVALLLALASGFLFGAVPVKQVLRTNPYEIVKAGSSARFGRRLTVRDVLLVVQIAICAVLVTSSMVAVRGLMRSAHSNFGFDPHNVMLVDTDLTMAGYSEDHVPAMQRRMIDAMQAIPGVTSVGLVDTPPLHMGWGIAPVFTDQTTDLKPSNAVAEAITYSISPEYLHAAETALLAGRAFTWQDDKNAPKVALVNREFAGKILGSVTGAIGKHYKLKDGTRIEVVGIVEDGKYTANLAEDPQPAMFTPILQSPRSDAVLVIRANREIGRDPEHLVAAIRSKLRGLDAGLPAFIQTWDEEMNGALFASRMATMSLGVLGAMGAMLSITGIFGMAAYSVSKRLRELGIRMALGAQRKDVLLAALGRPLKLLAFGSVTGLLVGILATRVLAYIVYQATPRDPLVLGGVVLAMLLLGLFATWIPAQRALGVNPMILLREE